MLVRLAGRAGTAAKARTSSDAVSTAATVADTVVATGAPGQTAAVCG